LKEFFPLIREILKNKQKDSPHRKDYHAEFLRLTSLKFSLKVKKHDWFDLTSNRLHTILAIIRVDFLSNDENKINLKC